MTTLSSRLLEHAAMHDDERRRYGGQHQAQWTADLREAAGLLAHVVQAEPDDKTLTLIGAQWHLNMLTGEDRADMLAFGRAVWAAALSAAQAPAAVQQASINAAGIDASEQRVDSVSAVQPPLFSLAVAREMAERQQRESNPMHTYATNIGGAQPQPAAPLVVDFSPPAAQPVVPAADPYADALLNAIQRINSNPYSLTKRECVGEVERMRAAHLAADGRPNFKQQR